MSLFIIDTLPYILAITLSNETFVDNCETTREIRKKSQPIRRTCLQLKSIYIARNKNKKCCSSYHYTIPRMPHIAQDKAGPPKDHSPGAGRAKEESGIGGPRSGDPRGHNFRSRRQKRRPVTGASGRRNVGGDHVAPAPE